MRSLIDILDFTTEEIDELLSVANDIIANPAKYSEICKGKKLATLFFEPSTRTRLSFEAAMYELGGNVLGFSSADSSSSSKGESVADTAKMVSKPGVQSWRSIQVTNIFSNCYNMNRELDSHMMKNTEWGAVAYLTVSRYGKGATSEVEQNKSNSYYNLL